MVDWGNAALTGLAGATRNLPEIVSRHYEQKAAGDRNRQLAELLDAGDYAGATKFAIAEGQPGVAQLAHGMGLGEVQREREAAAQEASAREGRRALYASRMASLYNKGDHAGMQRLTERFAEADQENIQDMLGLEGHRKVQGIDVRAGPDGATHFSPVIHNEQLGSQGPWTAGATADPGDQVISVTGDQLMGYIQPYLTRDGQQGSVHKSGEDIVWVDPEGNAQLIHQGKKQPHRMKTPEGIVEFGPEGAELVWNSETGEGDDYWGSVDDALGTLLPKTETYGNPEGLETRRTVITDLIGKLREEPGMEDGYNAVAAINAVIRSDQQLNTDLESGDREMVTQAVLELERRVRDKYGFAPPPGSPLDPGMMQEGQGEAADEDDDWWPF